MLGSGGGMYVCRKNKGWWNEETLECEVIRKFSLRSSFVEAPSLFLIDYM